MRQPARGRFVISLSLVAAISVLIGASQSLLGNCGPFTDVAADAFCPLILEIFTLGITTGTTATTFDPAGNVSRLQMAAFLSRTVDGTLKRAGRRAALGQFWTPQTELGAGGDDARRVGPAGPVRWDGPLGGGRRRNGDSDPGRRRLRWPGPGRAPPAHRRSWPRWGGSSSAAWTSPESSTGSTRVLRPGAVTTLATNLGLGPLGLAFDGTKIWSANGGGASVSIITPAASPPWPVTTVRRASATRPPPYSTGTMSGLRTRSPARS